MPRLAALLLALTVANATAALEFRGVNLSAAEFGHYSDTDPSLNQLPGIAGTDYTYADPAYFDYFTGVGLNTFRIPFRWERLQPMPGGALDAAELARLSSVVNYATGLGAHVILDVHNYARFLTPTEVRVLGTPELPSSQFSDLWTRLATEFKANNRVVFGLMNEPHTMLTETVVSTTNDALAAIRATGATNLALVQGNGFSGAHSWFQSWYGTPNATALLNIHDPGNNLAFEVHQYVNNDEDPNTPGEDFTTDYSGQSSNVESATVAAEKLAPFTDWLRLNNLRGFLGEIGTPASELGVQAMFNGVTHIEQNADVWLGWALWAGGPWWDGATDNDRYHLSVNPLTDGSTAPQLAVLAPYLVPEPGVFGLLLLAGFAWFCVRRLAGRKSRYLTTSTDASADPVPSRSKA